MNVVPMWCPGGAPMADQMMAFGQSVLGARHLGKATFQKASAGSQSTPEQCVNPSSWAEGREVEKASALLKP